jgi:ORF6N domain
MKKHPRQSGNPAEYNIQGTGETSIIPIEHVQSKILLIRGQKVILDSDLAELYSVATSRLNEQVKRNIERFPPDFAFRLSKDEFAHLKSHSATSSSTWGGRRKLPYAFTEHGVIMAAGVLNSERAVQVSVFVVRAFVRLKQMLTPYKDLIPSQEALSNNQTKRKCTALRFAPGIICHEPVFPVKYSPQTLSNSGSKPSMSS